MSLSLLSVLLGVGIALPQVWQLMQPDAWRRWSQTFPRHRAIGWGLTLLATAWFLWNVHHESLADFNKFKPYLLAGFAAVGVLTCIYVSDFLAVRGLALCLFLLAKVMVDTARWHESELRWVISALAYVWVIAGIWFTISPWRLRDLLAWHNATDGRIRTCAAIRLGVALFLIVLGVTAYRA